MAPQVSPIPESQAARASAGARAGIGDETTLLLWPAGPPEFGELPGGGPGTTVVVVDLTTGHHRIDRIPQIAPGDFPVPLAPAGPWLVYNGTAGVSAIRDDLRGTPRVLGAASYFVPAAMPDRVWLVRQDPSSARPFSVRSVTVDRGRKGREIHLPRGTAGVVSGTKTGLLIISRAGALELWRPAHSPRKVAQLGPTLEGAGFASDSRLVAYGSDCRLREATSGFTHTPVGYETCLTLNVIDVVSSAHYSFRAPARTLGWAPNGFGLNNSIAPGDKMLAAQAVIAPARTARTRLYLLPLHAALTPRPVASATVPLYARTAWSVDGSWLIYEGTGSRLRAREIATGREHGFAIPCCRYTAMVAIRTPSS